MENPLLHDPRQAPLIAGEQISEIGPVELNILERIENGLNISDREIDSQSPESLYAAGDNIKFTGTKEVIAVAGWASINSIYSQYTFDFTCRIIVGAVLLLCMAHPDQALWPLALTLLLASIFLASRHAIGLYTHWNGAAQLKSTCLVDLNVAVAFSLYFLGFALYFWGEIQARSLPFFSLPLVVFSLFLLFQTSDNPYLGQKRFIIIEVGQLVAIALKVGGYLVSGWSYLLFVYTAAVVYALVVGFFLLIILSCSFTGIIYQNIYKWKIRSLTWMSWYYLSTGFMFLALIKGTLQFYRDEVPGSYHPDVVYNQYNNGPSRALMEAGVLMMVLSFINLTLHMLWEKDIRRFLAKVVYRNEVQKEIALRLLSKSFTFRMVQISATYFSKVPSDQPAKGQGEVSLSLPNKTIGEKEPCMLCCERDPDIVMEPCNHGGICRSCMVNYLNGKARKCPFCKTDIAGVYLLEEDPKTRTITAKGQIVFKI
jgi:hypothetical protein